MGLPVFAVQLHQPHRFECVDEFEQFKRLLDDAARSLITMINGATTRSSVHAVELRSPPRFPQMYVRWIDNSYKRLTPDEVIVFNRRLALSV